MHFSEWNNNTSTASNVNWRIKESSYKWHDSNHQIYYRQLSSPENQQSTIFSTV